MQLSRVGKQNNFHDIYKSIILALFVKVLLFLSFFLHFLIPVFGTYFNLPTVYDHVIQACSIFVTLNCIYRYMVFLNLKI